MNYATVDRVRCAFQTFLAAASRRPAAVKDEQEEDADDVTALS